MIPQNNASTSDIRLAELVAALSVATDLGMGQPMEFALSSCVLAVRIGEKLGLSEDELRGVYYQGLLRYVGCNAETHIMAALVGDEISFRKDVATVDTGHTSEIMGLILRYIQRANAGTSPLHLARAVTEGLLESKQRFKEAFASHCEVAQLLGERLGFGDNIIRALGQLYERWDGRGLPRGLKGEAISPAVRIVVLAQDAVTFSRVYSAEAAIEMARKRKGSMYDPKVVECFCDNAPHLLAGLEDEQSWDVLVSMEPGERRVLSEAQLDTACRAVADFADIKSPFTLGHSVGVADLAASAARRCGLPESDAVALWRAGMLHDVGRVGVSAALWVKPGPLTDREWDRVRMHVYYTERVLARPALLAQIGSIASLHHERLDGSGYHRGLPAAMLSMPARILAAADTYHAMTETRPHRPARSPEVAADELLREVRAGKLDADACDAVLSAAGHAARPARREGLAGLSEREIEVLRLIARGHTMKHIAALLTVSPKTVDSHIQHIYTKVDVSTRAGATMYAMQHNLI